MEGVIIVSNKDLPIFEEICVDRFNGSYKVIEKFKNGYHVELYFSDIQDVFSLGQILVSEKIELKLNNLLD